MALRGFAVRRPGAYEEKTKENVSRVTKLYPLSDTQQVESEESQYRPGVVVSSTANGQHLFARISKSLPGNPPQRTRVPILTVT
jgi:hypothetical protein